MSVVVINPYRFSGGGGDGWPTSLDVIGAGQIDSDGNYARTGGTSDGRPNYGNGTYLIKYGSPGWVFIDYAETEVFYSTALDDPTATWTIGTGGSPAPTVTAA